MTLKDIYFVFQPIYELKSMNIYGYEALMRLEDIKINELIRKCNKYEDFYELEKVTWSRAMKAYKERDYKEYLFINSFPNICLRKKDLEELSERYPEIISKLVIEILESPELDKDALFRKKKFSLLNNSNLAIDDFGTGNNNLSTYLLMDPKYLKIDMSIIRDINNNKDKQEILNDIIKLAKKNNSITIAEGVETKEEFDYIKGTDVDMVQGYYLSIPI